MSIIIIQYESQCINHRSAYNVKRDFSCLCSSFMSAINDWEWHVGLGGWGKMSISINYNNNISTQIMYQD